MKFVDRILRKAGLMRIALTPYNIEVIWATGMPVHIDIQFKKNGQRVIGYVDPWYPNKSPFLLAQETKAAEK